MEDLKLFVWHNVLCDYSCGVMFALAEDVDSARKMLRDTTVDYRDELLEEPSVYANKIAIAVRGGG